MNTKILSQEVQIFIQENAEKKMDITRLVLNGSPFEGISIQELTHQIASRQKAKNKLPTWYETENIYFPPTLNLEQTSSEITAQFKSTLVSGNTLIDCTGGLGIDTYYFSKKVNQIIHCELDADLSSIVQHNCKVLKTKNIQCLHTDGIHFVSQQEKVDWIYIDPSRRHDQKGKVFFLEDCLPNVPLHIEMLFQKSNHILIKTSPLLDISSGYESLRNVKEIHCVAVKNEVKELLWVLEKGYEGIPQMICTNLLTKEQNKFSFDWDIEQQKQAPYSLPQQYVYEPNAAIMKSGGFNSVATQLNLSKLHLHSHLYTSETLVDFPGRRFEIKQVLPYQKKQLKVLGITKANITTRNFPETVAVLRKKYRIKDGGDQYLFFTTDCNQQKIVLICEKVV